MIQVTKQSIYLKENTRQTYRSFEDKPPQTQNEIR